VSESVTKLFEWLAGVDWWRLALAGAIAATLFAAMWVVRGFARRKCARLADSSGSELIALPLMALGRTTLVFMLLVAPLAGLEAVDVEGRPVRLLEKAATVVLFWQAGLWLVTIVVAWLDGRRQSTQGDHKPGIGSIGVIRFVARVAVWTLVVLLTLENLGVNIAALVAGLGIGGIAIALALQKVLGDLLASLSITLDQPFVIGDFVILDEYMGTVEYIGIKSTRLRSLTGEQIVISNADLLASRVRNYGRMFERRVVCTLGVKYETPRERLREIGPRLREIIESQDGVRFDRAHFATYGAYSLDFEVVYYVLSADYNRYMDIQQAINFRVHEEFEALGVEFAFPTQSIEISAGAFDPLRARPARANSDGSTVARA